MRLSALALLAQLQCLLPHRPAPPVSLPLRPIRGCPEALDGIAAEAGEDVAVDVARDADLAVLQPYLDKLQVDAQSQHERRNSMAYAMEADVGQVGLLEQILSPVIEPGHRARRPTASARPGLVA